MMTLPEGLLAIRAGLLYLVQTLNPTFYPAESHHRNESNHSQQSADRQASI